MSDLIIGVTIVAVGTSMLEVASSVIAERKEEHDIALGNVLGSNLLIRWQSWTLPGQFSLWPYD